MKARSVEFLREVETSRVDSKAVCAACGWAADEFERLQSSIGTEKRRRKDAEERAERLQTGLQRIVDGETPVSGLRPEFYGHARAIALETLESKPEAAETTEGE